MEAASFECSSTATGARIVSPELFLEQLVTVDDADAAFDAGFRREAASAFTHWLESMNLRKCGRAWYGSFIVRWLEIWRIAAVCDPNKDS
jgi:hypothetical protein